MPHPKVAEVYKESGLQYLPTAHDKNEEAFILATKFRPVKPRLEAVYRIKIGDDEHIYYNETLIGQDAIGNRKTFFHQVGKYGLPILSREIGPDNAPFVTGIDSIETQYDIEFSPEKLEEILKNRYERTKYYVDTGSIKYGSFTLDEYTNMSFEDLLYKGKTGLLPGTKVVTPTESRSIHKGDKNINLEQRIVQKT